MSYGHCATSSVYFDSSTLSGLHMEYFLSHPAQYFVSLACFFSDDSTIGNFNPTAKNACATSADFPADVLSPYTATKSTKIFLQRSPKSCSVLV